MDGTLWIIIVCVFMCMWGYLCGYGCEGQRSTSGDFPQLLPTLFFVIESFTGPELAGQWFPGVHHLLFLSAGITSMYHYACFFTWVHGDQIQVLMLMRQATLPTDLSPQPIFFFYYLGDIVCSNAFRRLTIRMDFPGLVVIITHTCFSPDE